MKPTLGDFTLNEYTEKVIQYGFLMLFAASFPLAPLMAILLNLIDIRIDARRMLWSNRRPIAYIRQDIGKWYGILNLVNTIGVITNGFLIGFTSYWASDFDTATKLWIVLGFEVISCHTNKLNLRSM
ncbi:anoctamin-1-like [Saccostrea cucullata]|uniref:anoctamin-1-like n=1 Tax=Saccostrea cuccullata TaxID=36930 RepID=UPI002ED0A1B3